jgi:nucleoside-diphosphate-sugar epimerase
VPDTTKARKLLGFEARTGIEAGLGETIWWHREQRSTQAAEG